MFLSSLKPPAQCAASGANSIVVEPSGTGERVGATEYGGPGDPSSGITGASGANLLQHPDSYAELGGLTFQTATAMGGLPYMTPLRVSWGRGSAIAYKRDFGLGGGPIAGLPRVIDLWYQLAERIGIPYEDGLWSGPVKVGRPPDSGAGNLLGQSAAQTGAPATFAGAGNPTAGAGASAACSVADTAGLTLTPGMRARLLPDGRAAAPQSAPA